MGSAGAGPRVRGRLGLRWLLAVEAVAILALTVLVLGGFRPAESVEGPPVAVDEVITLERWEIAVHGVELVDTTTAGSPSDVRLRVSLTVTLTGDESAYLLPDWVVSIAPGDGTVYRGGTQAEVDWGPGLDPGMSRPYVLEFIWPELDENFEQPSLDTVPATVAVVITDEAFRAGRLFSPSWGPTSVAGVVTVPLTDARTGS